MTSPTKGTPTVHDAARLEALIDELATLTTEASRPVDTDLDQLSTLQLVTSMNREDQRVAVAVSECLPEIAAAVDGIVERMRRGGRLVYVGAGTAGRLGVVDASECPPTFGTDPSLVVALIAGGSEAVYAAVERSEDNEEQIREELAALNIGENDTVVGISASGRTPYVMAGLAEANARGALTVAIACNAPSAIGSVAEIAIEVVVGPEFVAGSTRLKSGTAQKLVLNMLSTLTMVKLGKTYRGVMVDLQSTNEKLLARSARTVMSLTGADLATAQAALEAADGWVKLAVLIVETGVSAEDGRALIRDANDVLRTAIELAKARG